MTNFGGVLRIPLKIFMTKFDTAGIWVYLGGMHSNIRPLSALEVNFGMTGMMMPGRDAMCCRMCK